MVDPLTLLAVTELPFGGGPIPLPDASILRDFLAILDCWQVKVAAALIVALVVIALAKRVRRAMRRRRSPAPLHPKLQPYAGRDRKVDAKLTAERRELAGTIVATSSTAGAVGYEIVEQIEAVFVDGFRNAQDALEGLKAVAAMKSANAVINVHQERDDQGRFSASGDAVIVRKLRVAGGRAEPRASEQSDAAGAAPTESAAPNQPDQPTTNPDGTS